MASEGSKGDPRKGAKMKATKAAVRLAAMYGLDLNDVPVDAGVEVTVEHVKRYLEAREAAAGRLPGSGPAPEAPPPSPATAMDVQPFHNEDRVMVRGKFLGTVVGPEESSDGKRLWRVKSPSHSPDCETVAYAAEDLAKAIG